MKRTGHDDLLAIASRMERNGLVAAEAEALTGGIPDEDGVAECERIDRIERAAYLHGGVQVIDRAASADELLERVRRIAGDIETDRFRIGVHDPADRLTMTRSETAIAFADALPTYPDLRDPQHRFVVVARADEVVFGRIRSQSDASYQTHDSKPWTTSSSLDSRVSRALVNLVPDARSILDPCCGAGSIVIEAASLGIDAHGVDWKTPLVGMTRENLAHFGYSGTATKADSRSHIQRADAVVTDLPYGHAIDGDEDVIREIVEQCAGLAPRAVFVAPADITEWLTDAGFIVDAIHTVMKRKGFTRWVHVAHSPAT